MNLKNIVISNINKQAIKNKVIIKLRKKKNLDLNCKLSGL